jgi:hypothetical protein
MDIDRALQQLANAPLAHADLSQVETGVMRGLAQTATVIRLQTHIRLGAMTAAMLVGVSLGGIAAANSQSREALVSGAHLAPSALLAQPS